MSGWTITMQCPHCKAWGVSVQLDGCPRCGRRLMEPTDDIPSAMKPCGECGTLVKWPIDDDMVTCSPCVKRLVAEALAS